MVDWKKIREEWDALANPNSPDVSKYAAMEYAADNFPSLISAQEEQKKESKSDKERIEFLEKALEQAINVSNLERGVTSVSVSVDVPESFVSDGSGSVENLFPAEAFPELAKYLEEKNG